MTDFDYDCLQKKRLAQGARHRKRGSKSRACSLPSDYMTPKQWRERNGPCMTMNLNKPMLWADFKQLPAGMQTEYLQHVTDTYKVGKNKIVEMLGTSDTTFIKYMEANHLNVRFQSAAGSKPKSQIEAWNNFLGVTVVQPEITELPDVEAEQAVAICGEPVATSSECRMHMDYVHLSFNGVLDIPMILNSLRYVVGDGADGELKISFRPKEAVAES